MLIVWGIGIPTIGLIILIKNRHKLDQWSTQKYMLMLYQGLKMKRYYWEFVNTLRKVLLLSITVILATYSITYRVLLSVLVMLAILQVQGILKPYKSETNNRLEQLEILTGTFTLLSSILTQDEHRVGWIELIVFILIVVLNVNFLFKWTYNMIKKERDRYEWARIITIMFEYCLCYNKKKRSKKIKSPKKRKYRRRGRKSTAHHENSDEQKSKATDRKNELEASMALSHSNTNHKHLLNAYNDAKRFMAQSEIDSENYNSMTGLRRYNEDAMRKTRQQPICKFENAKQQEEESKISIPDKSNNEISDRFRKAKRNIMDGQEGSISYFDDSRMNDHLQLYEIHSDRKTDKSS